MAGGGAAAMAAAATRNAVRCGLWRGGLRRWYRTERGVYGYKPRKAASGRPAEPRGAGASGKAGRDTPLHPSCAALGLRWAEGRRAAAGMALREEGGSPPP